MTDRNHFVLNTLEKLRDGIDNLNTSGNTDDYNEGVFDAVKLVDEMIHQWTEDPEVVTDELELDT